LRNLLALPPLAILSLCQRSSLKISIKLLPSIGVIALMGCCVTPLLLYSSYQHIATGTATVFHFIYPAVVVLIGLVFFRKKINFGTTLAIFFCVIGICLFYDPSQKLDWSGGALALVSGVTYAIYVVLLSNFKEKSISGFSFSFYVSAVCSVVMLIVCLALGRLTLPSSLMGWFLCVLLAIVINIGAVVMFQRGTFMIGGERASILSTIEPLTGVVLGMLVFDEQMSIGMAAGSVLIILACICIAIFDSKH
jgi:drug/metabolite transporter (DMT)-like permease